MLGGVFGGWRLSNSKGSNRFAQGETYPKPARCSPERSASILISKPETSGLEYMSYITVSSRFPPPPGELAIAIGKSIGAGGQGSCHEFD